MPIRVGDTVQYIRFMGDDVRRNLEDWTRHEPEGEPVVGDYGLVEQITGNTATVAWRFGNTTEMLLEHLSKQPVRKASHRYVVLFENGTSGEDQSYAVWTEGGPLKAVYDANGPGSVLPVQRLSTAGTALVCVERGASWVAARFSNRPLCHECRSSTR